MPRLPRKGSEDPEKTSKAEEPVAAEPATEEGAVASHVPPPVEEERVEEPTAKRGAIRTPAQQISDQRDEEAGEEESQSRVSVVNESAPATDRSDDDEYKWHTGLNRPHGQEDAVEFI